MYRCYQCGTRFAVPVHDSYIEEVRPNRWQRFDEELCPVCSGRDFEEAPPEETEELQE